jgi:RNA polymerase sigma factor (sigma-70 family)
MQENLVHELLIQLQQGNSHAAAVIAALLGHQLYSCARNKYQLSHEDADDAVQTTMKHLIEHIATYRSDRIGGARWIWTIFRNAVFDLKRTGKHPTADLTEELIENALPDEDDLVNPETYTEYQEISHVLAHALSLLSEAERKELLRGRGRAGPKRKSLEKAEQHLRSIFYTFY